MLLLTYFTSQKLLIKYLTNQKLLLKYFTSQKLLLKYLTQRCTKVSMLTVSASLVLASFRCCHSRDLNRVSPWQKIEVKILYWRHYWLTTDLVVLALEVVVAELEAGEAAVVILRHWLQLRPGPGPIRDQHCDDIWTNQRRVLWQADQSQLTWNSRYSLSGPIRGEY